MNVFGVRLLGLGADTGRKLLLTVALIVALFVLRTVIGWAVGWAGHRRRTNEHTERTRFWTRQVVSLATVALLLFGVVSIWFDEPGRLATAAGLVTAGIAVALQRVITSFAAYFIILRGRVFTVGDRITMGGVRGDVVQLGFMQTAVMEMGEPPGEQGDPPSVWVSARQYTGRIVRVTNDKIFDTPVYNYTREFPFLFEEIHIPIRYDADRARAESILLDVARRHTDDIARDAKGALERLRERYFLPDEVSLGPAVYWRLTDNWIDMSVRFTTRERGARGVKDRMSRDIIAEFDAAGLGLASGTYEIVGMPPLRVQLDEARDTRGP
ncbi:MscS Mechanosensitive ion channel [Gemmatirosa kalamazoonensis]|jgi:small-conductance mechanosensitive channel|uniref:MscS Mechanosensitive ion channel n=1 Tax=Gemmatirosa kalamazoonensis TaxID=861299 RepID=W0RB13_9BACT|nr:mechanosensitive ion channel family protein [Gemmatirosa kalamazoonensis]AHG88269.1 MscS Mechanosensitive ion channel [Gemmatirosa kalamazoonensis]